eukprot:XP_011662471.1 PREDICTED: uncharacterized protein LOC100892571 [Strongylocentrotus purpuratus]
MFTDNTKDSAASSLPQVDLSWLSTTTGPERKRKKRRDTSAPKREKGRPSVRDKFPEVILTASRYIADNGFRAHRRRQESIGTLRSTIKNIKEHVQETVPGLQESHPNLSDRTVARWMMPPNRSCNASKSYAGLIEARVPAKENSARKGNDNSHFYSARVRYLMECASKHNHEVMIYSADNKNKVKVGDTTLAVDRRFKIQKIFPTNDKPVYYDHDFPTPGYLLTPSGYLELEPSTLLTKDNLGRDHYVSPQSGPSEIFLRSPRSACNIASHLDNMSQIIQRKSSHKSVLFMIVDGGPDFNVNHITNMFYYSRFFKDADLDALVITCTHALSSVYLRSTLEGEAVPPCAQARLSAQEKLTKEHMVFDAATSSIRDVHWNHLTFNGSDVNVHCVPSGYVPECGKDYVEVKRVLGGSAKALKESDFKDNFDFCMQHIDRRIGTIIFTKCKREECLYCARKPPRVSAELLDCLRAFPSPQPSSTHPGHFMTFGESLLVPRAPPCEHLPLFREKGLGRCSFPECSYVFNSQRT